MAVRIISAPIRWFFAGFNWTFEKISNGYGALTARLVRVGLILLLLYGGLLFLTFQRLAATPTGLIPQLDRTYFITAFQLPPGSSLERTDAVVRKAGDILLSRPGIEAALLSPDSTAQPSPTHPTRPSSSCA